MHEISDDLEVLGAVEAAAPAPARCDVCGTERLPGDSIACRACGEAVLGEEWTP
jgi:hypothetical protein